MATTKRPTTQAFEQMVQAEHKRAHAQVLSRHGDGFSAHFERKDARALKAAASKALVMPEDASVVTGSGEALLTHYPDPKDTHAADYFIDTLQAPDLVSATAALDRLTLLQEVGCVEMAQDVAATIQPTNSLERMLAGQLAAAHRLALKFLAQCDTRLNNPLSWHQVENGLEHAHLADTCRLASTAARLLSVFQDGMLALAKLRSGGTQTVIVQHVHVNEGGQAVVAGDVQTGGFRTGGEVSANEETTPCTVVSRPPGKRRAVAPVRDNTPPVNVRRSRGNGAAACTADGAQALREATATP
jgi:hypothetical protein